MMPVPSLTIATLISTRTDGHLIGGRYWHLADIPTIPSNVRYWTNSGHRSALALNGSVANDPTATSAVQCGNGLDAGSSPYQST